MLPALAARIISFSRPANGLLSFSCALPARHGGAGWADLLRHLVGDLDDIERFHQVDRSIADVAVADHAAAAHAGFQRVPFDQTGAVPPDDAPCRDHAAVLEAHAPRV